MTLARANLLTPKAVGLLRPLVLLALLLLWPWQTRPRHPRPRPTAFDKKLPSMSPRGRFARGRASVVNSLKVRGNARATRPPHTAARASRRGPCRRIGRRQTGRRRSDEIAGHAATSRFRDHRLEVCKRPVGLARSGGLARSVGLARRGGGDAGGAATSRPASSALKPPTILALATSC